MARLNYLKTGYAVADEAINRSSVTALKLAHDLIMALGFEVWTGPGKTGTKLTLTTDYVLSSEDTRYTTDVGSTVYTKLAIVNGTYLNVALYLTYTTNGDYASIENIQELIDTEPTATKTSIVDTDTVVGNDNADSGKRKKWSWETVKAWVLGFSSPIPKQASGVGEYAYSDSTTTPNVSGALYAVDVFNSSGGYLGSVAQISANYNMATYGGGGGPFATAARIKTWRTS